MKHPYTQSERITVALSAIDDNITNVLDLEDIQDVDRAQIRNLTQIIIEQDAQIAALQKNVELILYSMATDSKVEISKDNKYAAIDIHYN